jgi:hypothetical protein
MSWDVRQQKAFSKMSEHYSMLFSLPLKEPFYLSLIQDSYWNFDFIITRFRSISPGPKNTFGISFCSEGHFLSFVAGYFYCY